MTIDATRAFSNGSDRRAAALPSSALCRRWGWPGRPAAGLVGADGTRAGRHARHHPWRRRRRAWRLPTSCASSATSARSSKRARVRGPVLHRPARGQVSEEAGTPPQKAAFDPDLYLNAGAARIPHHHTTTLDYCRELGVAIEPFCSVNEAAYVYQSTAAPCGATAAPARSRAPTGAGQTSELLAKGGLAGRTRAPDDGRGRRERMLEWLQPRRWTDTRESALRGFGAARLLVGARLWHGHRRRRRSAAARRSAATPASASTWQTEINMQTPMFQVVGGTDGIVRALAARVGHDHARSRACRRSSSGQRKRARALHDRQMARPTGRRRVLHLDAAADAAARCLARCVTRSTRRGRRRSVTRARAKSAFSSRAGSGRRTTESLAASHEPIRRSRRFCIRRRDTSRARACSSATTRPVPSPGRWVIGRPRSGCSARSSQGAVIHPQYRATFENAFSIAWQKVALLEGRLGAVHGGQRKSEYLTLLKPDGALYLAGDYTTNMSGWMGGALRVGAICRQGRSMSAPCVRARSRRWPRSRKSITRIVLHGTRID